MADDAQSLSKRELERQVLALEKELNDVRSENRFLVARRNTFMVTDTISTALKCGTIVFLGLFLYWMVAAIAGKETTLGVIASAFIYGHVSSALAWLLAIVASIWAGSERKLRKRKVNELSRKNTQLEQLVDPSRTSSQLTD